MELRFSGTEVRSAGNTISGYASVFYRAGDPGTEYQLWPGVFERIDKAAMERALAKNPTVDALFNHDPNSLLGRSTNGTVKLSVDNRGLKYEIRYDPNDPDHQKVQAKIVRGDLTGSSFAFRSHPVTGSRWTIEGDKEIRTIVDLEIFDVSVVTNPAYKSSTTGFRSTNANSEARQSYEAWKQQLETEKRCQRLIEIETQNRLQRMKAIKTR